jgi:hypothetical protein
MSGIVTLVTLDGVTTVSSSMTDRYYFHHEGKFILNKYINGETDTAKSLENMQDYLYFFWTEFSEHV